MNGKTLEELINSSVTVYYPSSGWDFRDLMVMSGITPKHIPGSYYDQLLSRGAQLFGKDSNGESVLPQPNLFIHSDILSWANALKFKAGEVCFKDPHTSVMVKELQELPRLQFHGDARRFAHFADDNKDDIGRCALMTIEITSHMLGQFERQVVYVCSANEVFAAEFLLAKKLHIDGLVHVRYGVGFGGAAGSGSWLKAIMPKLDARFMFTDNEIDYEDHAKSWEVYPELGGLEGSVQYVDAIPARFWSNISDVQLVVADNSRRFGPRNRQEHVH